MRRNYGFTLVEIVVAVAVIGILAAIIIPNMNSGSAQARDAERKAYLRALQSALELYRDEYGRYPEGCNVDASDAGTESAWIGGVDYVSGEPGTNYECDSGNTAEYIRNDLSATVGEVENFAPQFISRLPRDPRLNGTNSGYVYITNPAGTAYKVIALNTVETETVFRGGETLGQLAHPFARCGDMTQSDSNCSQVPNNASGGGTGYVLNSGDATPAQCQIGGGYQDDYAVYGGFVPGGGVPPRDLPRAREYYTDRVHCW